MNKYLMAIRAPLTPIKNVRSIYCSRLIQNEVSKDVKNAPNPNVAKIGLTDMKVTTFQKRILVWGGKYKSIAEVPNFVNQSILEKARNKARIKINLWMGAATLVGCIIMIISGKRAAARGESITKINEEFRRDLVEKARQKDRERESK